MEWFIDFLKGKKSYLIAFAAAVLSFLLQMGWITLATYTQIMAFLVPAGAMALRAGMKNK